jgi:PmbA protein
MDQPSAERDFAFVQDFVAKARAAGADDAQVRLSYDEGVEIDFETKRLSMLRTTRQDDILLTVFKSTRKGSATIAGRARDAVARAVEEALAAAQAAPPDPANGIAMSESGPPTIYGPAEADQAQLVDAARAHIDQMAREHPAIVTRNAYHRYNRTRRSFANSLGVAHQETRGRYSFITVFAARRNGHATSMNGHGVSSYTPFARLAEAGALPQLYGDMVRSFDTRPAPGKFVGDVIVTPDALGGMLIWPLARALSGYSLLSGTSPYRERRGQIIASPAFSLLNRPTPRYFPEGVDFDAFGIPTGDLDVIRGGVLKDFLVDYYISRNHRADGGVVDVHRASR